MAVPLLKNRFTTLIIQSFQMLLLLGISGISKKMEKKYKQLISERIQRRGPLKYPNLASNLSGDELKRRFSFCAEHCQKD
jgi:hypothetical protein